MSLPTSVIVPAFNEGLSAWQLVVDLQRVTRWHEILVVDDGRPTIRASRRRPPALA
jgi:hypothetical protein